ncbi:MAG: EF-hand domain-containing protein [Hyphomonadaceae bacterium]
MNDNGKPKTPKLRIKKSETLEVRIPHETKQAFLNACREDGTTASEVVRDQVQSYLDAREQPQQEKRTLVMQFSPTVRRYGPRVAAGSLAALGLTALAVLPSAAAPDFKAQFARLDANGDGVLSVDEFLGPAEIKPVGEERNVVIETRSIVRSGKDGSEPPHAAPAIKEDAFTFYLPDEVSQAKGAKPAAQEPELKFISRHEVRETTDEEAQSKSSKTFTFTEDDLRKQEFGTIDKNADGKVSLDEYRARQTAMLTRGFEILDANSDKALSETEYARIVAPPVPRLDGPDTPEPPKIEMSRTLDLSPEAIKAAFTRLDANKDGKLSLLEELPKD